MATLSRGIATITVPDDVIDDYRDQGWVAPGDADHATPDDTWTVERLRRLAAEQDLAYKGLTKAQLLEALT